MKNLLLADLHRIEPFELIKKLRKQGRIDRVVCLGDYDSPEMIEGLLELDMPKVILPGNHDYPLLVDAVKLERGIAVNKQTYPDYLPYYRESYWAAVRKIVENPKLREFANRFVLDSKNSGRENYNPERRLEHSEQTARGDRIIYVHSSIFDSETLDEEFQENYQLWERMFGFFANNAKQVIEGNLREMQTRGCSVLFRGHDPWPMFFRQNGSESSFERLANTPEIQLARNKKQIITVGAYKTDNYAIFDDDSFKLEWSSRRVFSPEVFKTQDY